MRKISVVRVNGRSSARYAAPTTGTARSTDSAYKGHMVLTNCLALVLPNLICRFVVFRYDCR